MARMVERSASFTQKALRCAQPPSQRRAIWPRMIGTSTSITTLKITGRSGMSMPLRFMYQLISSGVTNTRAGSTAKR